MIEGDNGLRYDFFKSTLLRNPIPVVDYQFRDNLPLHVAASLLAGTFATSALTLIEFLCLTF